MKYKNSAEENFFDIIDTGTYAEFKEAIRGEANVNAVNSHGNTPLHYAAKDNDSRKVLTLINEGAQLNVKNNEGQTPLLLVIEHDNTEIALALIERGADVNIKNPIFLKTLLHIAIENSNPRIFQALMKKKLV